MVSGKRKCSGFEMLQRMLFFLFLVSLTEKHNFQQKNASLSQPKNKHYNWKEKFQAKQTNKNKNLFLHKVKKKKNFTERKSKNKNTLVLKLLKNLKKLKKFSAEKTKKLLSKIWMFYRVLKNSKL